VALLLFCLFAIYLFWLYRYSTFGLDYLPVEGTATVLEHCLGTINEMPGAMMGIERFPPQLLPVGRDSNKAVCWVVRTVLLEERGEKTVQKNLLS